MSDGAEEIRKIYRDYLAEELRRPEVLEAQKKLAAQFTVEPVSFLEPSFSAVACLLLVLFCFFYQSQKPLREVVLPETQPVMLALNPKPVLDAARPSPVLVKRISSGVGPTLVYQKNHHDIPITIVWVFPRGHAE